MALNNPPAREPPPGEQQGTGEQPTSYAELEIQVGPVVPWGTAKGRIPPEQTGYFIMTFGIWGTVVTGIAGAVLTLRIGPGLTGLALAELLVALAAALLIAACGLARERAGRAKSHRQAITPADGREGGSAVR